MNAPPTPDTGQPEPEDDPWVGMGGGLEARLRALHAEIRQWPGLEWLDRIAVATLDSRDDTVRTFVQSNVGPNPFEGIAGRLADYPDLGRVGETGVPLIQGMAGGGPGAASASPGRRLARLGYQSRYVVRIHRQGSLYGFIFFNSRRPGFFTAAVVAALVPYRRLIDTLVVSELSSLRAMLGAVQTALAVSHYRDEETGAHLDRMSHYARLVARRLASAEGLSDEYIEYLLQYAPLHDLGKVAIPDSILLKPGRLTEAEFAVMKTHVDKGVEIVDAMVRDQGLAGLPRVDLLRNMVACHHEGFDGSGYPRGLAGEAIPLEGRIAAVADVFDALTSRRPYKAAWSNEAAFAYMAEQAGRKFDPRCVAALLAETDAVAAIQQRFQDAPEAGSGAQPGPPLRP